MRVVLSTYGARGDVNPTVGLAVQLRTLGGEARACAPQDSGVPLLPIGVRR